MRYTVSIFVYDTARLLSCQIPIGVIMVYFSIPNHGSASIHKNDVSKSDISAFQR